MQPLESVTDKLYVPAVKPVTVVPVCPLTLLLQFNVNGGSPDVIYVVIDPSFPATGCNSLQAVGQFFAHLFYRVRYMLYWYTIL